MDRRPNILFFFSDQQRWDTCGCYGQRLPVTPHLDAMAADGVRFANAFSCQPVCGPCRSALISGRYPTVTGCETNNRSLPLGIDTVATQLRAAGYEAGYIGKWHLASDEEHDYRELPVPPERRGGFADYWLASDVLEFTSHGYDGHMFDADGNKRVFPPGRYRADVQTDWLLEYLETRDGAQPWFCICSYIEPHHQNDHDCYEGPHGSKERWADFDPPGDLAGAVESGDWREEYPDYLGCCHALDAGLGRVRARLAELGMADNTIIIYSSDHGSHFRTRNGEYKRSCHDASIRIPLIIHGPGFTDGRVEEGIASLIDLPATMLTAGGVPVPGDWHGRPLQDLLAGATWREEAFLQISESQCGRAVRDRRWTYGVTAPREGDGWTDQTSSDHYLEEYLYDNDADPHQLHNLIADPTHAALRTDLRERLVRQMEEVGEARPTISSAGAMT